MQLKKSSVNIVLTHIFFFALFLVVPTLAFVRLPGEPLFPMTRVFIQDTTANFVLLLFFYLNYYLLLPKFFFNHQYVWYGLSVVLFLSIALSLPQLVGKLVSGPGRQGPPFSMPPSDNYARNLPESHNPFYFMFLEFRRHLYLFFTAVFFSYLLRTREYLAQLKEEKLRAELASLKAQINPHFLFNTLNSIYVLSVKKDDKTSEAIIHLSGLMRYVIKDAHQYKIPLQKEIDYIHNYIELQRARLGKTIDVRFECLGEPGSQSIAPLILITYIENAFKYGISPDADDCTITITLQVTNTGVQLRTFNKKVKQAQHLESTGIGMSNTRDRLKHLYPNKHSLQIDDDKETYSVTLSIELV